MRTVGRRYSLAIVRRSLRDVYTREGVEIWLRSCNRTLDGQSPLDLLADGRGSEVVALARRVATS